MQLLDLSMNYRDLSFINLFVIIIVVNTGAIILIIGKQNSMLHKSPFFTLLTRLGFLIQSLYVINSPYSFAIT